MLKIRYYITHNPVFEYLLWMRTKYFYERNYAFLKIGYLNKLKNVVFGEYNWTSERVIMENVVIGDFSYISAECIVLECRIGKFCSIGPRVQIAPGKHPTRKFVSTHPALFSNPDYCMKNFFEKDYHNPNRLVEIGNDVWICANSVIADGVKIGNGAIIAANSVVTSDVEPYAIVGGVPARLIRYRFERNEIDFLLKLEWWNKGTEWIEANKQKFLDIKEMFLLHDNKLE